MGFNNKGKKYLNEIKKHISLPILTKYNDLLENEALLTDNII